MYTDGTVAYKVLHSDPRHTHYARAWRALARLAGSGVGDDHRPFAKVLPGLGPVVGVTMPLYGPTLRAAPLMVHEHAAMAAWLPATVAALQSRGVVHRDISIDNIARRLDTAELVLIDLDSCFVAEATMREQPENGTLCPFYGYPADCLPRRQLWVAHTAAVATMTMWFAAQALFNILLRGHPEAHYLSYARPSHFFGLEAVAARIVAVLEHGFCPAHIITDAVAKLSSANEAVELPPWAGQPAAWRDNRGVLFG
ncbi:MAG: phosphotransferase [Limisphaerales bacterium]